ncbi:MAG: VIT1/CCC1 transporter family protein [Candidatus Omnitrophota bacterium]
MRKWAVVVVALYGASLVLLTMPVLIAAFWDPAKSSPFFDGQTVRNVYAQWPYWLGVAVFLLAQAALLIIPVRTSEKRPASKRTVWLPVITAGFMMALLAGSFIMAITESIRGKEFTNENIWLWISLAVLLVTWVVWGSIFFRWSRKLDPGNFLDRICRCLFLGSVLELLVAVPTHIVARYRNYCCAGFGTFCGITSGIAIMLLSFGPGVFFLFAGRWKRLHPGKDLRKRILEFQENEITEYYIYSRLSQSTKDPANKEILRRIADCEMKHYGLWKNHSGRAVGPDRFKVLKYFLISRIFGLTYGIKLMEFGEQGAQEAYKEIAVDIPEALDIAAEENGHERELIGLVDEERMRYVGSVVLGLNDALVELTGALAGLTFALQNPRLVATAGFITGIAASLSMAASEYLSTKSEAGTKNPLKASVYTGVAYVITVLILIAPFLLLNNLYLSLSITLANAILIIYMFTFYLSIARGVPFKKRFVEMAAISLGIAGLSFVIGLFVRQFMKIEV